MVTLDEALEGVVGKSASQFVHGQAVDAIPVAEMREAWIGPLKGTGYDRITADKPSPHNLPYYRRVLIADHPETNKD